MKTYSFEKLDLLLKGGETLRAKQIGTDTYYLDKLNNGEFAVTKDDADSAIFKSFELANIHYNKLLENVNSKNELTINNQKSNKMSTIKLNDLKKTGKELNELLFDEPEINIKGTEEELKAQILEAAAEMEEGEEEELSETAQSVLKALKEAGEASDEPEEETKPEPKKAGKPAAAKKPVVIEKTLEEVVEDAETIEELKEMVKSNDLFTALRKGLGIMKNIDKLRDAMLDILEDEAKPKKASKPAAAPKAEKAPKKEAGPVYNRVDAVCEALKEKPKSIDEWIKSADEKMKENGKNANADENKFIIRYILKMAPHFDFGVKVPTE